MNVRMSRNAMTAFNIGRPIAGDFDTATGREWLVTNGLGGYAAGTVSGASTRRYHGLLVASFNPPVERVLLVSKLNVRVRYLDHDYDLSADEYADGTIAPTGYRFLETFLLQDGEPVWRYALADALLEQRILMLYGQNTTVLSLQLIRGVAPIELEIRPFCTYRDYHSHTHGGEPIGVSNTTGGLRVDAFDGAHPYFLACENASVELHEEWYWNFKHRLETYRGLDDTEDLFCPGVFRLALAPGENTSVVFTTEESAVNTTYGEIQDRHRSRTRTLLKPIGATSPPWVKQLALAADQFVVARYRDGQPSGRTVIAGYPWFSDWGRDTMIALPGIAITNQRFEIAAEILRTFGAHVSNGMLPNRFPDGGEPPEFNTVDATLWFFHAIDQYVKSSNDWSVCDDLFPVLEDIFRWYQRGTRYGIAMDSNDGLINAGQDGVQLTWMDAKVGDWVVTPRIGKPVEVNALWYNAVQILAELGKLLGKSVSEYTNLADRIKQSFQRYWSHDLGYLYDVIDGPADPVDASLRPNQIFAVSLPRRLLEADQERSVVDVCAQSLVTSHGLRSLAPSDPQYVAHYGGPPLERDGAYHQGTVWAWLLGPFVEAHYKVYRNRSLALSFLEPMAAHLEETCLGSVSEIFDGNAPHAPRGCFAQAWSVAEILRVWMKVSETRPSI